MKNKEIEELLKGMRDVSNTEGCSMNLDRYLVKLLLSYIEQLENNRDKAIEKLYCWGEVLHPDFQKEMLRILGDNNGN